MATNMSRIIIVLATAAALAISASATEYTVGDDKGWSGGFDYQAWADGKEFYVGDKLIFKYPAGKHNVFEVNEEGYQRCIAPPPERALSTGCDVITLETPGRKSFICGFGKHCELGGMKLSITVLPHLIPGSDDGSSSPSGNEFLVGDKKGWSLKVDYKAWTKGKEFIIGDKLVFKYTMGKHNVFKVDEPGFKKCIIPPPQEALASGDDVFVLDNPNNWFICGVGKHCKKGMKLFVKAKPKPPQFQGSRKLVPPKL